MKDQPTRSIDDGPWCWQNKEVRRAIRYYFEPSKCACSALSVYDALTELASNEEAETFTASTQTIADTAGVSRRTAWAMLVRLKILGFTNITTQKFPGTNMDAPSIYTLLPPPTEKGTSGNECLPVRNECLPVRNECLPVRNECLPVRNERRRRPLRTSEESLKNSSEESQEQSPPNPQPAAGGDGKDADELRKEEIWTRVCALVRHDPAKRKSGLDEFELNAIQGVTEVEMALIERYFELCRSEPRKYVKPKRLAHTLLAGFHGEVGKARQALGIEGPAKAPSKEIPLPPDWEQFLGSMTYRIPGTEASIRAFRSWSELRRSGSSFLCEDYKTWSARGKGATPVK